MWQRKISCHGGATWLQQKTVEMHTILGTPPLIEGSMMEILGMIRIIVHFLYMWTPMSTWFSSCRCNSRNFMKAIVPITVIPSQVSMHQVIVHPQSLYCGSNQIH
jgi:hypothetical protein